LFQIETLRGGFNSRSYLNHIFWITPLTSFWIFSQSRPGLPTFATILEPMKLDSE